MKIWANSGDSHFLEPEALWRENLPPKLAELVPYTERDPDGHVVQVRIRNVASFLHSTGLSIDVPILVACSTRRCGMP